MGIEKRKKQMNVGGWWSSMKEEGEWKGEEREEKRGWFYFCIYFSCLKENKMKKGKSKQTKCNIVNKKKKAEPHLLFNRPENGNQIYPNTPEKGMPLMIWYWKNN